MAGTTKVRDLMTTGPVTVTADANAVEAARAMLSADVGSLPVVSDDRLTGVVTDRDLVLRVLANDLDPHKVSVSEICSEDPVVADADESLDDAVKRMAVEQLRRLPVVEDGRLVGVLAQADVARSAESATTGELVERISMD